MGQPVIQKSFNSGEWAPQLYGRVDMERYHAAAALIRNFFVDFRGGISTRSGTKFVVPCLDQDSIIRLIPFQASFDAGYMLEFGEQYIRVFYHGEPVLVGALDIIGVTQGIQAIVTTSAPHNYSTGDMVYISGIIGVPELNNKYFYIDTIPLPNQFTLKDIFGNVVNTTGVYVSDGVVRETLTISSPYADTDLALLKFVQNNNSMIICHPLYTPRILTLQSSDDWLLSPIVFGASVSTPTGVMASTTLAAGSVYYSYRVTAIDGNGQESGPSVPVAITAKQDLRTTAGTNTISWPAVSGAKAYNVYKSEVSIGAAVPTGSTYGYIGQVTGLSLADSNIAPDFSIGPPVPQSPFANGSAIASVTITNPGVFTIMPTVTFATSPNGRTALGIGVARVFTIFSIDNAGAGYSPGQTVGYANGIVVQINAVTTGGAVTNLQINNFGANLAGSFPSNPQGPETNPPGASGLLLNFGWQLVGIQMSDYGSGYPTPPAITFSGPGIFGTPVATANLDTANAGNPAVPQFYQQRLVLGVLPQQPQTLNFSRPGSFFNYDVHFPIQDDDAISATLVSGQVNNIKAMISQTAGLIVLSDGLSWLINGGQAGSAVTPSQIVANPQSFVGINDMPPLVANYDILYVQSKGTGVRSSNYDFYNNVFKSVDISVWASHLFYGYTLLEWAWAEEPYKTAWVVRSDGKMLSLTYQREQEFVAWAHHDTDGLFKSTCTVVESSSAGYQNFVYIVAEREINGYTMKYIERFQERYFPQGVEDAWCVDCGLSYDAAPATTFSGAEFLAGKTVTGLADGEVIEPFVMPIDGEFTLPAPASKVIVGLPFTCQLKTLPLDLGEPTVQSKVKKINSVTIKVAQTLGLMIGSSFDNLVPMKDLIRGNVSTTLTGQDSQVINGLVDGEAWNQLDPTYTVPGQYCIQQSEPLPATILAVIPNVTVGDTSK